jgi:hypothetical protein
MADGAEETAETATGASTHGADRAGMPAGGAFGKVPRGHRVKRLDFGPGSIEPAEVASLGRWIAYIWPAIVADGAAKLLGSSPLRDEADAISLPMADVSRLLPGLGDSGANGVAGLAGHSHTASSPSADFPGLRISEGAEIALAVLIASGAALMTLLTITLRRELRAMYRWPFR